MSKFWVLIVLLFIQCTGSLVLKDTNNPKPKPFKTKLNKPKNIVLVIGDGMGLAQMTALMYNSEGTIAVERCPSIGLHKQDAANNLITDSAAGATAFSIGLKTKNAYLGIDQNGVSHETILEEASRKDYATGIVVSSTIVHATPAAFVSHNHNRNNYEEIAIDILDSGCDLIIGGGQKYFTRRSDTLDLISRFQQSNYFVTDYFNTDYSELCLDSIDKLLYFTADGDPLPYAQGRNYMIKASLDALNFLDKKNENPFFLMIEGSQIDWGGHSNEFNYVLDEMKEYNQMLNEILDWAEKDGNTLVVITGDHETGGLSILNGSKKGKLLPHFSTGSHTAIMVPVYVFGPGSENFCGIYENTEIYSKMRSLLFK